MKIVYYNEFDKDKAAESREQMTERKLMEAQYQAAIEAYKKVSRTRIDDSSRAMIAAIAEHVQYSSEAVLAHDRLITLVREMETALEGMLRFINVCDHTNTHREGAIWTKCDDCGKRFADDEGGVTPDSDPPQLAKALAALTKAKDAQEEIYAEDHAYQQEMEKLCGGGSFEMKAGFQRGWLSAIRRQSQQVPTAPQPAQEPRYTLKEIEAAILAQGNTDGGWPEFARAIRARLSPAPPDRAVEAVKNLFQMRSDQRQFMGRTPEEIVAAVRQADAKTEGRA